MSLRLVHGSQFGHEKKLHHRVSSFFPPPCCWAFKTTKPNPVRPEAVGLQTPRRHSARRARTRWKVFRKQLVHSQGTPSLWPLARTRSRLRSVPRRCFEGVRTPKNSWSVEGSERRGGGERSWVCPCHIHGCNSKPPQPWNSGEPQTNKNSQTRGPEFGNFLYFTEAKHSLLTSIGYGIDTHPDAPFTALDPSRPRGIGEKP